MAGLFSALTKLLVKSPKTSEAYIVAYDWSNGEKLFKLKFQYWPETVTESMSSEWAEKSIFGGTHPIYQWVRCSGRQISFSALFTTDASIQAGGEEKLGGFLSTGVEKDKRTPDLEVIYRALQVLRLPYYDPNTRDVSPPPMTLLVLEGAPLAWPESISTPAAGIPSVMTQCEIEHRAFFPHGELRMFSVSFSFNEIIQWGGGQFVSRDMSWIGDSPLIEK